MKINEIIKKRRNSLGLTQEQVADYLGVSTPAVNKWEKGSTYPDITLLPPLARLLKVDLNTLLSFKEDLSDKEIGSIINDLSLLINDKGFEVGFEKAMDKVHEYPTCDKLNFNIALTLCGAMFMYDVKDKEIYEVEIEKLFEKAYNSEDLEVRNQAIPMIINKYFEKKQYDKAQEYIDKLPSFNYDKKTLQGRLYKELKEYDKACEVFEGKLLSTTGEIFSSLLFMMEIALEENRNEDAKYFASIIEKTSKLYDLWEYNSYVAYFELYSKQKDAENCVEVLKKMLPAMQNKWDIENSNLYKHIKRKDDEKGINKKFFSSFINTLIKSCDNELSFLKNNKEFLALIDKYNKE